MAVQLTPSDLPLEFPDGERLLIRVRGRTFQVCGESHPFFWREVTGQEWEPETFGIFDRFLDSQHSYIDLGAWIGPTVLYGAQLARASYALEPDPVAFAELLSNLQLNQPQLSNVRPLNLAIAAKTGTVRLGTSSRAGDSSPTILARAAKQTWSAAAIRLEDLAQREGITDCNFIKMDIEGGEYEVVPSMAKWLEKWRPTLYLSLHPLQLFWSGRRVLRLLPKWRTELVAKATVRLADSLAFYGYCLDMDGKPVSRARLVSEARNQHNAAFVFTDRP